jgi:hypothetical protein
MAMLEDYARGGDTRTRRLRGAAGYVSDFDAWPETTPAATSALRDRAARTTEGPARPVVPAFREHAIRERSFA